MPAHALQPAVDAGMAPADLPAVRAAVTHAGGARHGGSQLEAGQDREQRACKVSRHSAVKGGACARLQRAWPCSEAEGDAPYGVKAAGRREKPASSTGIVSESEEPLLSCSLYSLTCGCGLNLTDRAGLRAVGVPRPGLPIRLAGRGSAGCMELDLGAKSAKLVSGGQLARLSLTAG